MTGMWSLVEQIPTHKANCMQALASVCVRACMRAHLILQKAGSDWPKNRMFSHSSVSQTHLSLPPPPGFSSLLYTVCLSDIPVIYFIVVGKGGKWEKKDFRI